MSEPTDRGAGHRPHPADGGEAEAEWAKAHGFRLVQPRVCLKRLVDPAHRHSGAGLSKHGCPFQLHLDRPRLWRTASGELFATAEPDRAGRTELAWLLAVSGELGLAVAFDGRSVSDPEHAFTVLITQPGSTVSLTGPATG